MTVQPKPTAKTAPPTSASAAPLAKSSSKAALVLKLLGRAKGATIAEIEEPTGWQPHSTRAHLSGLRKKGRSVVREQRKTGETAYRIVDAAAPATGAAAMPSADTPTTSSDSSEPAGSVDSSANADAATATDPVVA